MPIFLINCPNRFVIQTYANEENIKNNINRWKIFLNASTNIGHSRFSNIYMERYREAKRQKEKIASHIFRKIYYHRDPHNFPNMFSHIIVIFYVLVTWTLGITSLLQSILCMVYVRGNRYGWLRRTYLQCFHKFKLILTKSAFHSSSVLFQY